MKTGDPNRKHEIARQAFLGRKPKLKDLPVLRAVIRCPRSPDQRRIVKLANLPPDQLSAWVLRELSGCHPEYHVWTEDCEQISVGRIVSVLHDKHETPFEPVTSDGPSCRFRPLSVIMDIGRGQAVEMANIPATESGVNLVRRLMSTDTVRLRDTYHLLDFITTDFGWMPIRKINLRSLKLPAS